MPKYQHHIKLGLTDELIQSIKQELALQNMLGSIAKTDGNSLLLHILQAIDNQEVGPIFLMSIKEAVSIIKNRSKGGD